MADVTLAAVETAIVAIQSSGQSMSFDGVQYSRANLQTLLELRDKLKAEQERSSGQRPVFRGYNFTGMGY